MPRMIKMMGRMSLRRDELVAVAGGFVAVAAVVVVSADVVAGEG